MKNKIFALITAVILILSSLTILASAEETTAEEKNWSGVWSYFTEGNSVTISGCKEDVNGPAAIPSKIGNSAVTRVGVGYCIVPGAAVITDLTIPDSVREISAQAFMSCSGLKTVTLPDKIMEIGYNAFKNTGAYRDDANWDNGVFYLGKHLISGNGNVLNGVYNVKEGVYDIAGHAFSVNPKFTGSGRIYNQCSNLTGVTFPASLKVIGDGAFLKCVGLTDVTIPDTVEKIGEDAFKDTGYYRNGENWDGDTLYINNHLVSADDSLYGHCQIKEGTLTIAEGTFANCKDLTSVDIPNTVRMIDNSTFSKCETLGTITIPSSVAYIGDGAFYECSNLELVTFEGSEREWKNIVIGEENDALKDAKVVFTKKSKISSDGIFNYEIEGDKAVILRCDKNVEGKVKVPETLENKPVVEIAAETFANCSKLTEVAFPETVEVIGASAFADSAIEQIVIPSKVKTIKENTFNGCASLSAIQIPASVTSIGADAFAKCSGLIEVYYTGTQAQWKKVAVANGNDLLKKAELKVESKFPVMKSISDVQIIIGIGAAIVLTAVLVAVILILKKKKVTLPGMNQTNK